MSGTSTTTSPVSLLTQESRQPWAYSSSVIWRVWGESRSPETSLTRHLPHAPLPEQGASMATLARRAASSRLSPSAAWRTTSAPLTRKVTETMIVISSVSAKVRREAAHNVAFLQLYQRWSDKVNENRVQSPKRQESAKPMRKKQDRMRGADEKSTNTKLKALTNENRRDKMIKSSENCRMEKQIHSRLAE